MAAEGGAATIDDGHHSHPLLLRKKPRVFTCERCKCLGYGRRYICRECKVSIHDICATCPDSLHFFMHPEHTLTLERSRNPFTRHTCEACGDSAHGYFFRCKPCSFELHPFCSLLSPTITDDAHPGHTMAYASAAEKVPCFVCGQRCRGWRYVCRDCPAHVHMKCLTVSGGGVDDAGSGGEKSDELNKKKQQQQQKKTAMKVVGGFGLVLAVVLAAVAGEENNFEFDLGGDCEDGADFDFDMEDEEEDGCAFEVEAEEEEEEESGGEDGEEEEEESGQGKEDQGKKGKNPIKHLVGAFKGDKKKKKDKERKECDDK